MPRQTGVHELWWRVDRSEAGYGSSRVCDQVLELCASCDLLIPNFESLDVDGVKMCRDVTTGFHLPIVTAAKHKSEMDCVLALQSGADDYVVKSYRFRKLMARADRLMWRVAQDTDGGDRYVIIENGPLFIDVQTREVSVSGRRISLTPREFDLLVLLSSQVGEVVPRSHTMQRSGTIRGRAATSRSASRSLKWTADAR